MALWAVARRTRDLTLADVQAAFHQGDFLRTHVLRPTWHLIDPTDIHWMLALTAPRVARLMASSNTAIGLSADRLDRAAEVVVEVLADGQPHQRSEIAAGLEAAGLEHRGQALAHIMMHAEINALAANGPLQGKQHTYLALPARPVEQTRDELLVEAAQRYGRGHGAFRDRDLSWWTSLTLTDSRSAIELAGLRPLDVDGQTYWMLDEPAETEVPRAMLLSNFDEYISYSRDPEDYAAFDGTVDEVMRGSGLLMIDGRLSGTWTRAISSKRVEITVDRAPTLPASARRALKDEAAAFARFVDREPVLTLAHE